MKPINQRENEDTSINHFQSIMPRTLPGFLLANGPKCVVCLVPKRGCALPCCLAYCCTVCSVTWLSEKNTCPHCRRHLQVCDGCNEWVEETKVFTEDSLNLCQDCEENLFQCFVCGTEVHGEDDVQQCERCEELVCRDCHQMCCH